MVGSWISTGLLAHDPLRWKLLTDKLYGFVALACLLAWFSGLIRSANVLSSSTSTGYPFPSLSSSAADRQKFSYNIDCITRAYDMTIGLIW